jgi:hypothetical protein
MMVNSASVAVAMVLSLTGTSPFEPGLVARPPAGAAAVRLAAGAKLWAPKKSKPKSDDDEETAKKEEELLNPHSAKPAPAARSAAPRPASAQRPAPAAARQRRGIKMEEAANDEDEDDEEGGDDDDEDDKPKVVKRRKKIVEEEEDEEEDVPLPSLPVVRPRLVALDAGPTMMVRSFHYNTTQTPLQGDSHTRFGYQFALEAFPLLRTPPGFHRRIGLGISYEAESGTAGVLNTSKGLASTADVSMGRWGFDLRYALTFGARLVVVPALGYGKASAGLKGPTIPAPSGCPANNPDPCFASTNPSYLSMDLHIHVAATPLLSFSLVGGYLLGLGVQSGMGQISSSEATAKMSGFHVDVGASLLAYSDWLAVTAQVPIRQYVYNLTPTAGSAVTYRSATDTNYGFILGLAALAP